MQVHNLKQGTPAWHAYRAEHHNASDAPTMMGCSPYKTRSDLVREVATGVGETIAPEKQRIFDAGHEYEALARPHAENIVGEDLYPVVASEGLLSASFDGITMGEDVAFEHKSLNDDLRAVMVPGATGADLPLAYQVQMEQQCMVARTLKRVLFMASKWRDGELLEMRHVWYRPNPELAARITAGWKQFADDVCAYTAPAVEVLEPVATPIQALPALVVAVEGRVVTSNLKPFRDSALKFIAGIKTELKTDQDFTDADKTVGFCEDAEKRLDLVKSQALAQTESIDELFRTIDEIREGLRTKRLALEKLVKARKIAVRSEITMEAALAIREHVDKLNERLTAVWVPVPAAALFGEAISGKKTVASCRAACDTLLAQMKIDANARADRMEANRKSLTREDQDYFFLFADFATVGNETAATFSAIADQRIRQHQDAEADRKAREAIRVAATTPPPPPAAPASAPAAQVSYGWSGRAAAPAPAAADNGQRIKLGQINERLQHLSVSTEQLRALGFEPASRERGAALYRAVDFPLIRAALQRHLATVPDFEAAEA